jgi:N-acetylmuramoyl-L-alanine amidase
MSKIAISPSTQIWNAYKGGSNEDIEMMDLAAVTKPILEAAGHQVLICTGKTYMDNVLQSNKWGADYHIEEHTNAGGGRGTEVWYRTGSAKGMALAQSVYNHLALVTAAPDRGVKKSLSYGALNQTHSIAIIIEAEFHDYFAGAEEIRTHHQEYAVAIAEGIIEIAGRSLPSTPPKPAPLPAAHAYPNQVLYHKTPMIAGEHVTLVQRRLCDHGIIVAKDGVFGQNTENGVRRFQQMNHPLGEDGKVGPQTWAVLFAA